jgi:hypothetical protein
MPMIVRAALSGTAPVAFVSVEALLIVAACLAAVGALLTAWLVARPGRGDPPADDDEVRRRAPSPASVGLDEDPIVAALGIGDREARGPKR